MHSDNDAETIILVGTAAMVFLILSGAWKILLAGGLIILGIVIYLDMTKGSKEYYDKSRIKKVVIHRRNGTVEIIKPFIIHGA